MLRRIVECVPNFSEGRNPETINEIASAIRRIPDVLLLGQEQDHDHHRAVVTFVGDPQAVMDAAIAAAQVAVRRIDLRTHAGVHPRIGALDVLPFIPVQGVSLAECAQLARRAAQELWRQCRIPCYLYEAAALRPERRNLAEIRRGGFEKLRREVQSDVERQPDVGGPKLHPSAGAVAVGARKFLIAWNVLLNTSDVAPARQIAALIRQSSGGFPFVKALGLELPSRGLTQVSMNLLDYEETPMQGVFDAICAQAAQLGVEVIGSELIGFIPRRAIEMNAEHSLRMVNFHRRSVLENRIDELSAARTRNQTRAIAGGVAPSAIEESLRLLDAARQWANLALVQFRRHSPATPASLDHLPETTEDIEALRAEADQLYSTCPTEAPLPGTGRVGGQQRTPAEFVVSLAEHCAALKTQIVTGAAVPLGETASKTTTQPGAHSAVLESHTAVPVLHPSSNLAPAQSDLRGDPTAGHAESGQEPDPGSTHANEAFPGASETLHAAKQLARCAQHFALIAAEAYLQEERQDAAQATTDTAVRVELRASLRRRINALRELDGKEPVGDQ